MSFNKLQKLTTFRYMFFLILMLFFLTPFIKYSFGNQYVFYGNFFIEKELIVYPKLLIQIALLTIFYGLIMSIFKSK